MIGMQDIHYREEVTLGDSFGNVQAKDGVVFWMEFWELNIAREDIYVVRKKIKNILDKARRREISRRDDA